MLPLGRGESSWRNSLRKTGNAAPRILSRRRIVAAVVLVLVIAMSPWTLLIRETWTDVGPADGHFDHADAASCWRPGLCAWHCASPFLRERVAKGVRLYQDGYVDRLIVSGDGHDTSGYGEPTVMRALAEDMGVAGRDCRGPVGPGYVSSCVRGRDRIRRRR